MNDVELKLTQAAELVYNRDGGGQSNVMDAELLLSLAKAAHALDPEKDLNGLAALDWVRIMVLRGEFSELVASTA